MTHSSRLLASLKSTAQDEFRIFSDAHMAIVQLGRALSDASQFLIL